MASYVQPRREITATTAPGKTFESRQELADHYKSDWHRYNLKRKENNLASVDFKTFDARLKAAQAMKAEREAAAERSGTEHLKGGNKEDRKKEMMDVKAKKEGEEGQHAEEEEVPEGDFEIDPCDDLFDLKSPRCLTVEENLTRMADLYGFFLPDAEYCVDKEGLLGYCHEKVKLGHYCLFCQRIFTTAAGAIQHMRDKGHTMIKYEEGVDMDEFDVFYDFSEANEDYMEGELPDDLSDDEEGGAVYDAYEANIKKAGFKVNELGELVLPTGKVIGHRALKRYYDQYYVEPDTRTAIVAAKNNVAQKFGFEEYGEEERTTLAVKAGLQIRGKTNPNRISGREGAGVLVKTSGGGFTTLSLYRYRRMAKVQRHQEDQARHYKDRKHNNTNRMDKKGNRLMNGVSVAHAKR